MSGPWRTSRGRCGGARSPRCTRTRPWSSGLPGWYPGCRAGGRRRRRSPGARAGGRAEAPDVVTDGRHVDEARAGTGGHNLGQQEVGQEEVAELVG